MIEFIEVTAPTWSVHISEKPLDEGVERGQPPHPFIGSGRSPLCEYLTLPILRHMDKSFGVKKTKEGRTYFGDYEITFDLSTREFVYRDKRYPYTKGLLSLMTHRDPSDFTKDDLSRYKQMVEESNLFTSKKKHNGKKWREIIRPMWSGTVVLSSDPQVLLEKLNRLIGSGRAGNTGVYNEIIAIVDELVRMGVMDGEKKRGVLALIR